MGTEVKHGAAGASAFARQPQPQPPAGGYAQPAAAAGGGGGGLIPVQARMTQQIRRSQVQQQSGQMWSGRRQ